jgi:epoxyqueuosine reductase
MLSEDIERAAALLDLRALGITGSEPFVEHAQSVSRRLQEGSLPKEVMHDGYDPEEPFRASDPSAALAGARSTIVLSLGYMIEEAPMASSEGPSGRLARMHWWDSLGELARKRDALMAHLRRMGVRCAVPKGFPVKAAAARAGLGSYGKNSIIQTLDDGSWNVLCAIVTDAPLQPDEPMGPRCGSCRRCMGVCPTKAITAPYVVDARRCLNHLLASPGPIPRELRRAVGDRLSGCDACQEACPRNWYVVPRRPDRLPGLRPGDLPLLPALRGETVLTDIGLRRHSPPPPQLRRNAAVALGNSGWEGSVDALASALADEDAQLRAHSAWALGQIGGPGARAALREAVRRESDPAAEEEIGRALDELRG